VQEAGTEATTPATKRSPSPSPISMRSASPHQSARSAFAKILGELTDQNTDTKIFKELCEMVAGTIKERASEAWDVDTLSRLGEALLCLIRNLKDAPHDRFKATLQLLEVFGEHPEWKRPGMPDKLIVALMGAFLNMLNSRVIGKDRLGDVNMCFVKFLTNLPTKFAYWSLLSVLKDEERLVSLVIKCMKKVGKNIAKEKEVCSEEKAEREARTAMEVVLSSRHSVLTLAGSARRQAWLEGAREVIEIARRWLPEVIDLSFDAALANVAGPEDQRLLEELWGRNTDKAEESVLSSKENMPVDGPDMSCNHGELKASNHGELKASLADACPQPPSSPCVVRNA